jgi:preflagellin peptidase FlaK
MIDIIRIIIVLSLLIYASKKDLDERKVSSNVWYSMALIGALLSIIDISFGNPSTFLTQFIGNILIATIIAIILDLTNMMGKADTKAIIALSIILPTYPQLGNLPLQLPILLEPPLNILNAYIITIIGNTAIIAIIIYPLHTILINIKENNFKMKKPGIMMSAVKCDKEEIENKHGWVLPKDKSSLNLNKGIPTEFIKEYKKWTDKKGYTQGNLSHEHVEEFINETDEWNSNNTEEDIEEIKRISEKEKVWITRGIPLILPLTLGVVISLTLGDILYILTTILLG